MICVAISEPDVIKCMHTLDKVEMAEIRLDLTGFNNNDISRVFSHPAITIATCRPGTTGDKEQLGKLKAAMMAGAHYVDIEIDAGKKQLEEIKACAHKYNTKIIISYHNFNETPGLQDLYSIVETCYELGADVAKIATMVNSNADNARILSLYNIQKPLVALGMGHIGMITRLMAPFLGAEFTFASMDEGEPTAPGQIGYGEMKQIVKFLNETLEREKGTG